MKTKWILIEGIPGSGKSTSAKKIAKWYQNQGISVNLYIEGQLHPADLGWNACIPVPEYDRILDKYALLSNDIKLNTVFEGSHAIVAYTQVKTENWEFYKELENFEVYDGRVPDEVFYSLHYDRWNRFALNTQEKDEINIFECAFMQNHVNELLFWRNTDEKTIIDHHNRLIGMVKSLNPTLIYLSQPDIKETIQRIAEERVSPDGDNWIDRCIAYCENSTFGKKHGIKGFDGIMEFFTMRKRIEMDILAQLPIPYVIIENPDYNWEGVWLEIVAYLQKIQ